MPYLAERDNFAGGLSQLAGAPARVWYTLTAPMLGGDLPTYGRAFRVRLSNSATVPLVMVVVPIGEPVDANTQTFTIDEAREYPFGVRRIETLNGGTSIPAGVEIQIII